MRILLEITYKDGSEMKRKGIVIALCIVAVIILSCFIYVFEGTKMPINLCWNILKWKDILNLKFKVLMLIILF